MKTITMIPVRISATRLPNKPLLEINGKSLMQRVYENVKAAIDGDICISTPDEKIVEEAAKFGAKAVLTPYLPSGTDCISYALEQLDPEGKIYDIVVNFQGDNINVDPKINNELIKIVKETNCDMATVGMRFKSEESAKNPNDVKIIMGLKVGEKQARALYFSRALSPYIREAEREDINKEYYHHIGIYVFKASTLKKFPKMEEGVLERREKLEQLRFLENGYHIEALIVDKIKLIESSPADINTPEEYEESKKHII